MNGFKAIAGAAAIALQMGAASASAEGMMMANAYMGTVEGSFDEVFAELQDAAINRGVVIDYVGHVGDMLARTGEATGIETPYADARYFQFCSAQLSGAAMAVDPSNIAVCPFVLFAYELKAEPGKVTIGYRRPFGAGETGMGAVSAIEEMLKGIVDEAMQ